MASKSDWPPHPIMEFSIIFFIFLKWRLPEVISRTLYYMNKTFVKIKNVISDHASKNVKAIVYWNKE